MRKCITTIIACMLAGILCLPVSAYADDDDCPRIDKHGVAFLFDRWNDSLKTLSPEKVTANYAKDAVLLPTLSNKPRTGRQEILSYFKDFLKLHPAGKIDQRVIRYGEDWASDTGLYTFRTTENGITKFVEARYSFVYECIDDKWLIVHHHSSLMPPPPEQKH
jgi:uncharacterized protein (TIGR02246 family)